MGQTFVVKSVVLNDGNTLQGGTVVIEDNFIIYVSPVTGKYQEIFSWSAVKRIVL